MFKYTFTIKTTLLESIQIKTNKFKGQISAELVRRTQFLREVRFLRIFGALNESLTLIIIYYMFKYSVGIKTTLIESLRSQKSILKAIFRKTSYNDLAFAQNEFLRLFGAPNQSLILTIIYYMFKYLVGIKTNLLESLRSQKSILKAIFRQNQL